MTLLAYLPTHSNAETKIDLSYYFDSRDFNTFAFFIQNPKLGDDFSLWGFSDFHSAQNNKNKQFQIDRTFSEYRLSHSKLSDWTGIKGLGLQIEYDYSTPSNSQVWRAGLTYQLPASKRLKAQLRLFPAQNTRDEQVSLGYFYKITDEINITGFADYNLREDKKNQWVIEPQLNYKLAKDIGLIVEYRYNGFERDNPNLDGSGWAIGIKWKVL